MPGNIVYQLSVQYLDEVVESTKTVRVLAAVNVHQGPYFGGVEADMLALVHYL